MGARRLDGRDLGDNERGLRLRGILRNHGLVPIALGLAWALSSLPAPATLSSFAQGGLVLLSFVAFLAAGLTLARARVRLIRDVGVAVALRVGVSPSLLLAATPLVPIPRAFVLHGDGERSEHLQSRARARPADRPHRGRVRVGTGAVSLRRPAARAVMSWRAGQPDRRVNHVA